MNDDGRMRAALAELEPMIDPHSIEFARVERRIRARARQRTAAVGVVVLVLLAGVVGAVSATSRADHARIVVPASHGSTAPTTPDVGRSLIAVQDGDLVRVELDKLVVRRTTAWLRHRLGQEWLSVSSAPDGHTLIATRANPGCPGRNGNTAIYRLDVDAADGAPQLIASFGDHVVLSPDGTHIAFHGWMCDHDSGIFLTDLRDLVSSASVVQSGGIPLTFSPDSQRVLVQRFTHTEWLAVDHAFAALAPSPLGPGVYAANARTTALFTVRESHGASSVVRVDPASGEPLQDVATTGPDVRALAVDPAGSRFATIARTVAPGAAPGFDLVITDTSTHAVGDTGHVAFTSIAWLP